MIRVLAAPAQIDDFEEPREGQKQGTDQRERVFADDPDGLQKPRHPEEK